MHVLAVDCCHLAAQLQVTSRSISGPGGSMLMIPLIDLANHCSISSSHANGSQGNGTAAANPRVAPDQLRFRTSGGAAAGPGQQGAGSPGGGVVLELVAGQALAAGDEVGPSWLGCPVGVSGRSLSAWEASSCDRVTGTGRRRTGEDWGAWIRTDLHWPPTALQCTRGPAREPCVNGLPLWG